jgi:hypothetical protein
MREVESGPDYMSFSRTSIATCRQYDRWNFNGTSITYLEKRVPHHLTHCPLSSQWTTSLSDCFEERRDKTI